jgi:Mitochondrial carrier protein
MWSLHSWLALLLTVGGAVAASRKGGGIGTTTGRRGLSLFSGRSSTTMTSTKVSTKPSTSEGGPLQLFTQTILDARRHLTAAAVARSTSIFIMYPADALKTRLQMQQADAFRLTGLFNGVGGSLVGQVPYGVLTFGSYELYKGYLLDRFPNVQPIFKYALAAILGDLTGSGWLCTFYDCSRFFLYENCVRIVQGSKISCS